MRKFSVAAARTLLQFPAVGGVAKATGAFKSNSPSFGALSSNNLEPIAAPEVAWALPGAGAGVLEFADEVPTSSARSLDAAQNGSFGEIFENISEPLWPVGAAIVGKAAVALQELRRHTERASEGSKTTGLTRTALTSYGTVEIEGEYPGDTIAIGLLSTWLYRFATGRFPRPNERQVPSQLNSNVPKWVDAICVRGLSYDAEMRYTGIKQFQDDLEERLPGVSRTEIGGLVRRVLARLCPSEEILAGELAGALRIITLPPPDDRPSSSSGWLWGVVLIVALTAGLAVWKYLFPV